MISINEFLYNKEDDLRKNVILVTERNFFKFNGKRTLVRISKEIRKEYLELFLGSINKSSILSEIYSPNKTSLNSRLRFKGKGYLGSDITLDYFTRKIRLEINYEFDYIGKSKTIESGIFTTYLDKEGNLKTDLKIGKNFSYHYGFGANHRISNLLDKIQESKFIPHLDKTKLEEVVNSHAI